MVNIGYRAARIQGNLVRFLYSAALPWIIKRQIPQTQNVQIAVYSFSCDRDLPEQVASIRSFIRYVGIPKKFIVISDGSYSEESCTLLCQIHPCVNVINWKDLVKDNIPNFILDWALNHPHRPTSAMWKRMAVFLSISIEQPTLYTDADILFFPGAEEINNLCQLDKSPAWYLPDITPALDKRLVLQDSDNLNPVNAGFFLLNKQLSWEKALTRVVKFVDLPIFHTDQSVVHLAMHDTGAKPLSREKFVLSLEDQCVYPDHYAKPEISIRHYVSPVRHKFWMNVKN